MFVYDLWEISFHCRVTPLVCTLDYIGRPKTETCSCRNEHNCLTITCVVVNSVSTAGHVFSSEIQSSFTRGC